MALPEDFVLQALQNIREDLSAMEGRLNRRLDEIRPQCQNHGNRIDELEKWRAHSRGVISTTAALVSGIITVALTFIGKFWRN